MRKLLDFFTSPGRQDIFSTYAHNKCWERRYWHLRPQYCIRGQHEHPQAGLAKALIVLLFLNSVCCSIYSAPYQQETPISAAGGLPDQGVIVEHVANESEGARVGLQAGDIILAWSRGSVHAKLESPFDWLDIEAMFKVWVDAGFGSERFGRLRCVVTYANLQPAAAAYVCRPGDSTFRAMALDVLRIEDGVITEIVVFPPDTFPLFALPLLMDPAPEMNASH